MTSAVRASGVTAIAVGGLYLCAWLLGIAPRWSASGVITMKTNAALAIAFAGSALLVLGPEVSRGWKRWAGVIAAALVLLIGASTLSELLFHRDLGLDQLLATEPTGAAATSSPNRMGLPASSSLTLIGLGLLALTSTRTRRVAPYLGVTTFFINLVPAVGYLFGIGAFYAQARTGIAWPTVAVLQVLGLGLTLAHPGGGPAAALLRRDAGAMFLRRLLPWTLVVPLALGFLRLQGERAGLYDASTGTGALVIALVLFFSLFLWRSAANLSHAVAKQERANEALRESDARASAALERLRIHVETTPLAVVEWDADYRVTRYSRRAEELYGWSAREVLGKRIDEIPWVPEEDRPSLRALMSDMSRGALPTNVNVNRNVRRDGSVIHCEWYNSTLQDDAGRLTSVLSLILDVTDRKRAEEALREEERKYRGLFENSLDAVYLTRQDGTILDANRAACRMHDMTLQELEERGRAGLVVNDERHAAALKARTTAGQVRAELTALRKDGTRFPVEIESVVVDARQPEALAFVIARDITERKRAEEALRESERKYATIFRRSPLPKAWSKVPEGTLADVNDEWVALMGVPREEAIGKTAVELGIVAAQDRTLFYEHLLAHGSAAEEMTIVTRARGLRTVFTRVEVVTLAGKQHLVAVLQDITEQKRMQDALRDSDRRKSEFLAVLSHELRNPLAPIRNAIYILDHADATSVQSARAKDIIRRQTEHLARMVDDLLDVMRMSRGTIQLKRQRIDLVDAVRKATDDMRSLFERGGVELRVEHSVGAAWVDADATRIAQVLANLLQNSAKFVPPGGAVDVNVAAAGGRARLRIKDTGIGIEPRLLARMFEPFAQADQGLARATGGLGLGLHLVKSLVELHGGSVAVHSEGVGRGAEFVVSLPLAAIDAASERASTIAGAGAGRDVLLVEDNADAADTLAEVLTLLGHRVRVARDGASGLVLARERKPDVILCDVGLPDMDGYEVARAVRGEDSLRGTRLVALTGYAQPEDLQRAVEAGFDAHLAKPPDPEALARALEE